MMEMILSCVQPSYLAWIPLFKRMQAGDVFVYLDDVEYSKNSFHNRNYIKNSNDRILLTVPIKYKGNANKYICNMPINNDYPWRKKHWRSIQMHYQKAPYFDKVKDILYSEIYNLHWENLGDLNITFIEIMKDYLKISCDTYKSSELNITTKGNQKLVDICKHLGADNFIIKPGTEHYHPKEFFNERGIDLVEFKPIANIYDQQYTGFIPDLSVLDYVMNCGAGKLIW